MMTVEKAILNTHSKQQRGTYGSSDSKDTAVFDYVSHTDIQTKNSVV